MSKAWRDKIPEEYLLDMIEKSRSLDLGCGRIPRNPLNAQATTGVDILFAPPFKSSKEVNFISIKPFEKLPFEGDKFMCVSAFDFLEHVPRQAFVEGKHINPFIEIMNEIYRVLTPGGFL